jgi:hypothetical protein
MGSISINKYWKVIKEHKIFKLGQPLKKNQVQIWDKLSKNKITVQFGGDEFKIKKK